MDEVNFDDIELIDEDFNSDGQVDAGYLKQTAAGLSAVAGLKSDFFKSKGDLFAGLNSSLYKSEAIKSLGAIFTGVNTASFKSDWLKSYGDILAGLKPESYKSDWANSLGAIFTTLNTASYKSIFQDSLTQYNRMSLLGGHFPKSELSILKVDPWRIDNESVEKPFVSNFFEALKEAEELLESNQEPRDPETPLLQIDFQDVIATLIKHLAKRPEDMRTIDPRKFEELVARLFEDKGYEVKLTPRSNDGGFDVLAIENNRFGAALTLVECKRYAVDCKVGVEIVRGLYGVVEQKRATRGVLATTSFFTKGAHDFRNDMKFRIGLADFNNMKSFIEEWMDNQKK